MQLRFAPARIQEKNPGELFMFRDGETTIKIKFALLRGGWAGGQRGKLSKTLFFVGTPRQYNFESENFIVEKFCCHGAGSFMYFRKRGGFQKSMGNEVFHGRLGC